MKNFSNQYSVRGTAALDETRPASYGRRGSVTPSGNGHTCALIEFPGARYDEDRKPYREPATQMQPNGVSGRFEDMIYSLNNGTCKGSRVGGYSKLEGALVGICFTLVSLVIVLI